MKKEMGPGGNANERVPFVYIYWCKTFSSCLRRSFSALASSLCCCFSTFCRSCHETSKSVFMVTYYLMHSNSRVICGGIYRVLATSEGYQVIVFRALAREKFTTKGDKNIVEIKKCGNFAISIRFVQCPFPKMKKLLKALVSCLLELLASKLIVTHNSHYILTA